MRTIPTLAGTLVLITGLSAQSGMEQLLYRSPASHVMSVKAADINGDGELDMVIGSGRGVYWSVNDGQGGWGDYEALAVRENEEQIAITADLDMDGDVDIVLASRVYGHAAVLLNNGDGTFAAPSTIASSGSKFTGLRVADLDGDGDLDLLAVRSSSVYSYLNDGAGGLVFYQSFSGGIYLNDVMAVGDLTGDGLPDVVCQNYSNTSVDLWRNDGTGIMTHDNTTDIIMNYNPYHNVTTLAIVDADGDGDMDVFSDLDGQDIFLYRNDGTGSFPLGWETSYTIGGTYGLYAAGAGNLIVVSSGGIQLDLLVNGGDGLSWTATEIAPLPNNCRTVDIADVNGDGELDVIYGTYTDGQVHIALWNAGTYATPENVGVPFGAVRRVYSEDLNGDGYPEVVACTNEPDRVMIGLTNGPASVGEYFALDSSYNYSSVLAFGDLDGDGDLDIVRSMVAPQRIEIYRNDGTGHFAMTDHIDLDNASVRALDCGDLDGDGDLDIAYGRLGAPTIGFYRNNGDGTSWTEQWVTYEMTMVNGVFVRDIDGDGDMDIAAHTSENGSQGRFWWFRNTGNWNPYPYPWEWIATTTWDVFISGDFADADNDGDLDILGAQDYDGVLFVSMNNGSGIFTPQQLGTFPAYALRCAVWMDVDGDGYQDAVSVWNSYPNPSKVEWRRNDGAGGFESPIVLNQGPYTIYWIKPMDFDGDGDKDLLCGSSQDQAVFWIENYFGSPYSVQGRTYFDVDGNGESEPGEPGFTYAQLSFAPDGAIPYTVVDGQYSVLCDTGVHVVGHAVNTALWQLTSDSATYHVHISDVQPVSLGNDFGFLPSVDSTLAQPWYAIAPHVCGDTSQQWVGVSNQGSTILHGTLRLTLDTLSTFIYSVPPPSSVSGNVLAWDVDSVFYYSSWSAQLSVLTPSSAFIGDTLLSTTMFEAMDEGGSSIGSFTHHRTSIVTCSYDPNVKQVEPQGYGTWHAVDISTDRLEYTVQFQNTGNAPAQNVVILDQLDPLIDPASLVVIATSHPLTSILIGADAEVEFRFVGIQLPDSTNNESDSHGFVRYTVSPRTAITSGSTITNWASIHFDLNPPVITDTTLTTFIDCALAEASITEPAPNVLQAPSGSSYQWYLNGVPIDGGTEQVFLPTASGSYTVQIKDSYGCTPTSGPFVLIPTDADALSDQPRFAAWPVPARDEVHLIAPGIANAQQQFEVINTMGVVVRTIGANGRKEFIVERGNAPSGIYLLRWTESGKVRGSVRIIWE